MSGIALALADYLLRRREFGDLGPIVREVLDGTAGEELPAPQAATLPGHDLDAERGKR